MKILLSLPYAIGEHDDWPDCVAVLVPSKWLFKRMLALMRKAEKLEAQIDGFVGMDVQDWSPIFINTDKLLVATEKLDSGKFHEIETPLTEKDLQEQELVEESPYLRIESCVARIEKERVGWEFYTKYGGVPYYTGTLDREFVEKQNCN